MATTEAPVSMAEAFPRETEWRTVTAPAARAWSWVPSVEPSSTTMTRSTRGMERQARTVVAMRSASSLAGMTTATRWSGRLVELTPPGYPESWLPADT